MNWQKQVFEWFKHVIHISNNYVYCKNNVSCNISISINICILQVFSLFITDLFRNNHRFSHTLVPDYSVQYLVLRQKGNIWCVHQTEKKIQSECWHSDICRDAYTCLIQRTLIEQHCVGIDRMYDNIVQNIYIKIGQRDMKTDIT